MTDIIIWGNTENKRAYWATPLLDPDATDGSYVTSDPSLETGDAQISKDFGSFTNTTNDPVYLDNGWAYVELTQSELQAQVIIVTFIDQDGTKAFMDTSIIAFTGSESGSGVTGSYYNLTNGNANDTD